MDLPADQKLAEEDASDKNELLRDIAILIDA